MPTGRPLPRRRPGRHAAAGGYHGFSAEGGTWCAITGAGQVLTAGTPDELARAIRAHWQAMQ